jgi:DNA processing protein
VLVVNEFILALLKCNKIGNTKAYEFIKENGFDYSRMKINLEKFIGSEEFIHFDKYLEESFAEIEKNKILGINIITILDDRFPSKLFNISDPILYLYYKGNIDLISTKSIAVIGTRHPSEESIRITGDVVKRIVDNNYTIVGGLALGIDTIGHQVAIDNRGKTIAVLPTGLDNIQPTSNRTLADNILKNNGCLVSEYSVGTPLNNFNYAKRDRIQSALSNAIFVGEAAEKSGTMIAVNKAIKENIPVFQLETNNNSFIKNEIGIDCHNINSLFKLVDDNYKNEINRKELLSLSSNEQISLF